jgi:hypothetical protein
VNNTANDRLPNPQSKYARWWPVLIAPSAVAIWVIIAGLFNQGDVKVYSEPISPPILAIAALIFAFRAWRTKNPLCMVLTGLAIAFTCREIHFTGTDTGIKVALAILVVWTISWRKRLLLAARDVSQVRWVAASALTYAMCRVIEKRAFSSKHLGIIPNEEMIHVTLEEGLELVAHLLLLLSAVMGSWKVPTASGDPATE